MDKQAKVNEINSAISRSETATTRQAKATLTSTGTIQYTMLSRNGRYTQRATFGEVLALLWGADLRALSAKYGRH